MASLSPVDCATDTSRCRGLLLPAVLVFGGAAGFLFFQRWYLDHDLQDALAEASRLDPHWTLAELDSVRDSVPDQENSALQVLAAGRLIPVGWQAPPSV